MKIDQTQIPMLRDRFKAIFTLQEDAKTYNASARETMDSLVESLIDANLDKKAKKTEKKLVKAELVAYYKAWQKRAKEEEDIDYSSVDPVVDALFATKSNTI